MKTSARCLGFAALILLSAGLFAEKPHQVAVSLHVDDFHLLHLSQERAEAEINISVTTDVDVRIEHVDFRNSHANGVPFFAAPIETPLDIRKGEKLALPPVHVTMYLSDLDSLQPLMDVVDRQETQLQSEIALTIHANTIEHLALGSAHPLAIIPINQRVAVQTPGGPMSRTSTLTMLRLAQAALSSGLLQRPNDGAAAFESELAQAQSALSHARTCYSPKKTRDETPVCVDELAFAVAPELFITSADAGEPWRFNEVLDRELRDEGGHPQKHSPRITLQPLGNTSDATQAQFEIVGKPDTIHEIVIPDHSELSVLDRATPGVYGRLRTTTPVATSPLTPASLSQTDTLPQLAIFRLTRLADGTWQARAIYLSGTLADGQITFSRPVDRSTLGSPILTPQGFIGVVQSEAGGTLVTAQ